MKKYNKGATLVELILAMIILSIGLTGVLSLMMTTVNNSIAPELRWQVTVLGESIIQHLLEEDELSAYQGLKQENISTLFPLETKNISWAKNIKISIEMRPYQSQQHATLITIVLQHALLGETHFSAIKVLDKPHE